MSLLKSFCAACLLSCAALVALPNAYADVRVDIKNETTEECSVAFNARVDKTKWMTIGWYVFVPSEEGPVILKGVNDIHEVFVYHDCGLTPSDRDEVKRGWIKTNLRFTDYVPKDKEEGYQEVSFVRLTSPSYVITQRTANP